MRRLPHLLLAACTALLLLFIHSCSQAGNFQTEPQALGNGTVHAYVELNEQDHLEELGVALTESALSALPAHDTEIVLQLPAQAAATAFTHIGFNWRSHGHAPSQIYDSPHFDVHFYTLTPEERNAITATGSDLEKAYADPHPNLLAAGYVLAPDSAEPHMGAHWVDPTSDELQGTPHGFTHTLIYGYYDGQMSFIEPMVTLDFLKSQDDFEGAIAVPNRYSREGAYPTTYRITHNEATGEHIIALTGFIQSQPES